MRKRVQFILFFVLFMSVLGLSVLFPILAPLARELGLSVFQTGFFPMAYALMQLIASPYWGRVSDARGRTGVMLIGMLGFTLSFLIFAVIAWLRMTAHLSLPLTFWLLVLTRLVGGFFSSATFPAAQAYMADQTEGHERVRGMGLLGSAFGLGIIIGPAIGGFAARVHILFPFVLSALLGLISMLLIYFFLPEPERHVHSASTSRLRVVDPRFFHLLLLAWGVSTASVALETTLAFYIQDIFHLPLSRVPGVVAEILVWFGLVAVFTQGVLVRRLSWLPERFILTGIPLALLGMFLLAQSHTLFLLLLALLLIGLGQGFLFPGITAGISLLVERHEQGLAAGLSSAAQALGRVIGPLIGTALYQFFFPQAPYVFNAFLFALLFLLARKHVSHAAS